MSDFDVKEKRFEEDIEDYLTHHGGYTKGDPKKFNRESGLDEDTFVEFIKTSQPKKWERYVKIYAENSEKQIIERFKREVKTTNLLNVMRHGFMDRGIKFYPIFWKPETSLNETTQMQYDANILHCTRQLHYSVHNENSIDIVLFANGIPVVSMELKCQFTGQDTTNAINQYKFDRAGKDAIFAFKERVLVHFAVDLTNVYMTTRLEGAHTYFLPFNQGSNGAGKVGGKGNPVNPNGYDTAYLWERVLCKDSLMEILQKYMHLQQEYDKNGNLVKETMIFPRYHQLDVVTKLLEDVKKNGSGKSYLIQHSAGSGKSNSIAWLAHRLTGLHDYEDNKIFQSVIIVTDRRVLDSQLQSTVYQFDHVEGVVKKVDKNSGQLRDAINDGVGIIITTLQKFPVIYKEVDSAKKRFAIIIDEAHSSQTGDAAKKLKRALADTEEILKEYAEMEDEDERNRKDDEDKLLDELAAQGMHKNLSFFAFTATPKGKTLQLFGQKDAEGIYRPFHIYSMRQAIEEHFILDVLQNYMTYKMYYKIAKIIEDNPEFDTTAGSKAIINYETLHPHNISQKTAIMLEHFMNVTRHKIGGRAKAMVVTPSRLHAVRYVQEFKRQIKEKGLNDLEVLVAFSGEVKDNDDVFTEEGMNKDKEGKTIKEKALPETFHADDYGILVVAEKYQTGFDEPLLHTMIVDKKLKNVKAVQTLSRLNRTCPGKVDTFVLDFANKKEDILEAFQPFYQETSLEQEVNVDLIYQTEKELLDYAIYNEHDINAFINVWNHPGKQDATAMGKMTSVLKPIADRYNLKNPEERYQFRRLVRKLIRWYSYITQVVRMFDEDMHKEYLFLSYLIGLLPEEKEEPVDLDGKLKLEYYKLQKTFEGAITLDKIDGQYVSSKKQGVQGNRQKSTLDEILDKINEKYKGQFSEGDRVMLGALHDKLIEDDKLASSARTSDPRIFTESIFPSAFGNAAMESYMEAQDSYGSLFEDKSKYDAVMSALAGVIYREMRSKKTVDYRKVERDEQVQMVAEEPVKYGK